nr:MAG TPA: hypothetical protein [Caudoviricetes sp.]
MNVSENELIGTIYSYLLEEFGFGYIDKDLWMIAENLSEKIANEQPQLNENQKLLLEDLREIKESQKDKNMLGLIWVLGQRFTTKSNIKSFTDQEILQVLQALKQEEE